MTAIKRTPLLISQESLEKLVENLENRALTILNRDNYGLETLSEDIYKLREDKQYMDLMKYMVSGFIINKEDFIGRGNPSQEDLDKFVIFNTILSHRLYLGQKRKSNKPYFLHSCRMNQILTENLKGRKISYISTCLNSIHDVFEEQKIDIKSTNFKDIAKGLQIPLELYKFVYDSKNGIKNQTCFYRGIDSLVKGLMTLTKPEDTPYIFYLYNIFYSPKDKEISEPHSFLKNLEEIKIFEHDFNSTIEECSSFMNPIKGVNNLSELMKLYIMDVDNEFRSSLKNKESKKKHIRRTIIDKLCDFYSNSEDLTSISTGTNVGYDISTRVYRYFKGFIPCHATFEKYTKQEETEREEYDKIMPLAKSVLDLIIRESNKDLKYLETVIDEDNIKTYKKEFIIYQKSKNYKRLSTSKEDKSEYAGTFRRYLRKLVYKDERKNGLEDYDGLYRDLLLLNSKFRDFQEQFNTYEEFKNKLGHGKVKRPNFIEGFSLGHLKQITKEIIYEGKSV